MKKLTTAVILGVALFGLSGCGKDTNSTKTDSSSSKDKTEQVSKSSSVSKEGKDTIKNVPDNEKDTVGSSMTSKSQEQTTDKQPEVSKEKVSEDPQAPEVDKSIRDKEGSESSLGKARITLYEAGIDSHTVGDADILNMWNSSNGNKDVYVQKVKEFLGQ